MPSRLATARNTLHTALAPILPGRVDLYPPPAGVRVAAPRIWIGDHDGTPDTIGSVATVTVTVARFAVFVVYDGAVHAQVAGLDDLVSAVVDQVDITDGFSHDGWRTTPLFDLPDSTLRAVVVTATATITARTLCPGGTPTFDVTEGPNDVVFTPLEPTAVPSIPLEAVR